MIRDKIKNQTFRRIGDRYNTFIDLNHFLGRNAFEDSWMTQPKVNVKRNSSQYDLEIGLPGYQKDDIKLSVYDGVLEVIAHKPDFDENPSGDYLHKEMEFEDVKKVFQLAPEVDREKIESVYENGLLKVRLPLRKNGRPIQKVKVI